MLLRRAHTFSHDLQPGCHPGAAVILKIKPVAAAIDLGGELDDEEGTFEQRWLRL